MSKVAYVLGCYPEPSETFIRREIEQLRRLGVEVTAMSLRRPAEPEHGVIYRSTFLSAATARALLWALLRPIGCIQAFSVVLCLAGRPVEMLKTLRNFATAAEFARQMQRRGLEQVHAHFVNMPATVGLMITALTGVKFSFTAHAQDLYVRPAMLVPKISAAWKIVGCTEFNANLLRGDATSAEARRIFTVYHGVDTSFFRLADRPKPQPPLVFSAGRLIEKKGFDVLIDACARLASSGVDFRCEIAGDGPLREVLQAQIGRNGLAETVALVGGLSQEQMLERYAGATVFALPCVVAADGDHDGLPNVLLEAAACGVALVSTPVGGIPELVRDGETGLLVPERDPAALAEAVKRLLADAPLRAKLAAAARRDVEQRFGIEANVRRLAEVLELLPARV